jgi:hypothetical protein
MIDPQGIRWETGHQLAAAGLGGRSALSIQHANRRHRAVRAGEYPRGKSAGRLSAEHGRSDDHDHTAASYQAALRGEQQNWSYAAYELGELRNAFARITRTIPRYHALDTASITTAVTQAPLDAIDQAIKARNPSQFTAAYAQLTQACNACHQSLGHSTVVIKVPTAAVFPDQEF